MGGNCLLSPVFVNVTPFRATLLSMLRPFDIAKLLVAIDCGLSEWERERHMDVLDDIIEDNQDITIMKKLGITVRLFGSDLSLLQRRLWDPCSYLVEFCERRSFHVFVVATARQEDDATTFVYDFRVKGDRHLVPEDMNINELQESFHPEVSTGIVVLSRWMLCAPYLSGSLSNSIPGWIPVFNARPFVNIHAYISTFNGCNSRILHMNRTLIGWVFGYEKNDILLNLSNLTVQCITIDKEERVTEMLLGRLVLNYIQNILLSPNFNGSRMVVVNSIPPLGSAITLGLQSECPCSPPLSLPRS